MINRILNLDNVHNDSAFVWGAQKFPISTFIKPYVMVCCLVII